MCDEEAEESLRVVLFLRGRCDDDGARGCELYSRDAVVDESTDDRESMRVGGAGACRGGGSEAKGCGMICACWCMLCADRGCSSWCTLCAGRGLSGCCCCRAEVTWVMEGRRWWKDVCDGGDDEDVMCEYGAT